MADGYDDTLDVPGVYREEDFLPAGAPVGRYVILSTLGVGGMGIVYSAFDPELDRKVAIKVLRRSAESEQYQELLLREAKSMARVSHRNVAAVFDVGTVDGNVFLAMEHIDGLTLKDWAAHTERSEQEVVTSMVAAGRGLWAAHRAGVLHRDFKPANVLVGTDGRVVVTDFGIAQAVAEGESHSGARPIKVGTPAYMAPEALTGAPSDARADQFSFCVTVYELLYGVHPFEGTDDGIARAIVNGKLRERPRDAKVSARIHAIVERGLSYEAEDRFASMEELLAALLDDTRQRRRKWIAGGFAAGAIALVVLSLTGGDDLCGGFAVRAESVWGPTARAAAEGSFQRSGVPYAQQAFELTDAMLSTYADDWVSMQTESCRATEEDRAQTQEVRILRAFCLEGRMKRLSAMASLLQDADASVVEKATEAVSALPAIDDCADVESLSREVPPPEDPLLASTVEDLRQRLARARSTFDLGKVEEGIEMSGSVLADAKRVDYLAIQAEAEQLHGRLLQLSGASQEAEIVLRDAIWSAVAANYDVLAFESWNSLADALAADRKIEASRQAGRTAEAFWVRLDRDAFLGAKLYAQRGLAALQDARLEQAVDALEQGATYFAETGYGDHPLQVSLLGALAAAKGKAGQLGEAAELNRQATEISSRLFGSLHPQTLTLQMTRGNMQYFAGDYEAALQTHTDLLRKYESLYGEKHKDTARAAFNTAIHHIAMGNHEKARATLERVVAIRTDVMGPKHPQTLKAKQALVHSLMELEQYDAAARGALEVIADQREALGEEHHDLTYSLVTLAEIRGLQARHDEAIRVGREALGMIERVLGSEHPFYGETLNTLGTLHERAGQREPALARFEAAVAALEAYEGDGSLLAAARFNWAKAAWSSASLRQRAIEEAQAAAETYRAREDKTDELREVEEWLRDHVIGA